MTRITYLRPDTATSTNSYLATLPDAEHGTVVSVRRQTAGRGQRGNTWESEPGKNLTMSILLRPQGLPARCQFFISEAVALAVVVTLDNFLDSCDAEIAVKWPNDIYAGDKKICGILIENVLSGTGIERSIAGIGLNVNQQQFLSDAPNPVSMYQLAGGEFPLQQVEETLCRNLGAIYDKYIASGDFDALHYAYLERLWRRNGFYSYRDAATGRTFSARIAGIGPMGHLTLTEPDGTSTTYAFKEVAAIL